MVKGVSQTSLGRPETDPPSKQVLFFTKNSSGFQNPFQNYVTSLNFFVYFCPFLIRATRDQRKPPPREHLYGDATLPELIKNKMATKDLTNVPG